VFKCPDAACTSCLTYNATALRGICNACAYPFTLINELCVQTCGNGTINGAEQCDDGNLVTSDGCTDNCTIS